ncbi:MAG: hypothetical protein QXW76_01360 [Candidatus Korarchaeum sp.]
MSERDHLQQWDEVRQLYNSYRNLRISTLRSVLECWADRRPVEESVEVMERVFPGFWKLRSTAEGVISHLEYRDWRGCIVNIVGDYGSGKTQMGFILLRMIRDRGEAHAKMIAVDPFTDLRREVLEELEAEEKPLVLIVDEVDQLISDLERGRREKVEEVADLARMLTEGSFSNPARGSVILLLSKKARNALRSDRSLSNRLMDRAREFSLSMSETEREKVSLEAVKRILALWMACREEEPWRVQQYFHVLYPFMERLALELSDTHEIGGVVKNLTIALEEVMLNLRYAPPIGRVEEGRFFEDLLKRFLKEMIGKVPFKVRIGEEAREYLAVFSDEPLSVPGARTDAHYDIWTSTRGLRGNLLVNRVGVEIKYGEYWRENRDQLLRVMERHPLLLLCVADMDPDEVMALKVEMRAGGRAFDMINADPKVLRVAYVMTEEGALRFLRDWGKFDRDVEEAMSTISIQSLRVEDKEVSERDLIAQASSSILASVIRDLRKAKKSVRTSTLSGIIGRSVQGVYAKYGKAPPEVPEHLIFRVLRVLEREGLGRLSDTGKTFSLDRESKQNIEEVSSNDERRKMIEAVISEILLRVHEHPLKLDATQPLESDHT